MSVFSLQRQRGEAVGIELDDGGVVDPLEQVLPLGNGWGIIPMPVSRLSALRIPLVGRCGGGNDAQGKRERKPSDRLHRNKLDG